MKRGSNFKVIICVAYHKVKLANGEFDLYKKPDQKRLVNSVSCLS